MSSFAESYRIVAAPAANLGDKTLVGITAHDVCALLLQIHDTQAEVRKKLSDATAVLLEPIDPEQPSAEADEKEKKAGESMVATDVSILALNELERETVPLVKRLAKHVLGPCPLSNAGEKDVENIRSQVKKLQDQLDSGLSTSVLEMKPWKSRCDPILERLGLKTSSGNWNAMRFINIGLLAGVIGTAVLR